MNTKGIIFDLGSVIASNEWPLVYDKIAQEAKLDPTVVAEIIKPLFKTWCTGSISEAEFWRRFQDQSKVQLPSQFVENFFLKTYQAWSEDIKGTWYILEKLYEQEYKLGLLSDTVPVHVEANEAFGRFDRLRSLGFTSFVFSYEEQTTKPDPTLYNRSAKELSLSPEACVFIDDKQELVDGARAIGMTGLLFTSPEELEKLLTDLSILKAVN